MMETPLNDTNLLERFVADRSQDAFEALVARHVTLVFGVCERGLGQRDADDATQAVFLALAQKAASLRGSASLSGWLYRTAQLTVAEVRRRNTRRSHHEQQAARQAESEAKAKRVAPMPTDEARQEEIRAQLDQAVASLRAKQQDAVVLHYLQGKSLKETAAALGCSEFAAKKRVAYALEKLREYFARHGVTTGSTALGAALLNEAARTAPSGMAHACAAAAAKSAVAAGSVASSVLKTMFWAKLNSAAALCAMVMVALIAALGWAHFSTARSIAAEKQPAPPAPIPTLAAARDVPAIPAVPLDLANDRWNSFGGTTAITVTYGAQTFEIQDSPAIAKLLGALKITQFDNDNCQIYVEDRTLAFHQGAKGDLVLSIADGGQGLVYRCAGPGNPRTGLFDVDPEFFNALNTHIHDTAHKDIDFRQEIPREAPAQIDFTAASLKAGLKSARVEYEIAGRRRYVTTEDPALLKPLAEALGSLKQLPDYKLNPANFRNLSIESNDGAQQWFVLVDAENISSPHGHQALSPELKRSLNRIASDFEQREIDVVAENPALPDPARQGEFEKFKRIIASPSSIALLRDSRGGTTGGDLNAAARKTLTASFTYAELLPQKVKAAASGPRFRFTSATGESVTLTFCGSDNVSSGLSDGEPVEVSDLGQVWINTSFKDEALLQELACISQQIDARAMTDFPNFLSHVKCAIVEHPYVVPDPFGGNPNGTRVTSSDFLNDEQCQRVFSLLQVAALKPDPKMDFATALKSNQCAIKLSALIGHDLRLYFTGPTTAVVDNWGTVEFKHDVLKELIKIANAYAAERKAQAEPHGDPPTVKEDF